MNDYLSKPFKVAQLGEMLKRWSHPASGGAPHEGMIRVHQEGAIDSRIFDD